MAAVQERMSLLEKSLIFPSLSALHYDMEKQIIYSTHTQTHSHGHTHTHTHTHKHTDRNKHMHTNTHTHRHTIDTSTHYT